MNSRSHRTNSIVLLGWTTLSRKQIYQVETYAELADKVYCLTNDSLGDSKDSIAAVLSKGHRNVELAVLRGGPLDKIWRTVVCLLRAPGPQKIAILPPAGRLSMLYFILAYVLRFKIIVVEWGSIADLPKLHKVTAINMRFCYRNAHAIWYKEPYMKDLLLPYRKRPMESLFFIPNSSQISPDGSPASFERREIDFLWANRMVDSRYPEMMLAGIQALKDHGAAPRSVFMGVLPDHLGILPKQDEIQRHASPSITVLPFGDPFPFFANSRFFVFIADHIFGNNALLESMHFGVVPVVNHAIGVEKWLNHGRNAIIFDKDRDSIESLFLSLNKMTSSEWERLSRNAVETARQCSKIDEWKSKTHSMVQALSHRGFNHA